MQRRDADRTRGADSLDDALGIHAGIDALKGRDAALLVLLDAAGHVQPVDAHGNDQVAVREILGVNIHVHAGDVAQTGHVLRALEHGVQQRALLQVDVLHAGHKQRAAVVRLDEVAAERGGIVYKAIRALQTVIRNGYRFSEPESVTAARERYMGKNSTVVSFFDECMCPWPKGRINPHCTTGRIYRVYQAWCRENNNGFAKTAKEFRETLAAHLGCSYADMTTRQKGNTLYKDYSLTLEAKEQYAREYGYDGAEFL